MAHLDCGFGLLPGKRRDKQACVGSYVLLPPHSPQQKNRLQLPKIQSPLSLAKVLVPPAPQGAARKAAVATRASILSGPAPAAPSEGTLGQENADLWSCKGRKCLVSW